MTDAERAEVVRRGIAAWNDDDEDGVLEMLEPDFEMRLAGAFLGLEREYRGHGGFRAWRSEFRGMWKRIEVGLDGIEHFDVAVVADAHFAGVGRDDLEIEMPIFASLLIPETQIRVWANFLERDAAVEAARELAESGAGGPG